MISIHFLSLYCYYSFVFAKTYDLTLNIVLIKVPCLQVYKTVSLDQAYRKAQAADPSYNPASEFLAIVLTDLGTSLKLADNTEEGIKKYCEALEVDSHYAVPS
jgi:hypothetical protein